MNLKVAIINLNWNGWRETILQAKTFTEKRFAMIECLGSLYQISYPNYDVIVDNDSKEKIMECVEGKSRGGVKAWKK